MISKFKIYAIGILVFAGIYATAFYKGYVSGQAKAKIETLEAVIAAKEIRQEIEYEIDKLDPVDVCVALGGVRDKCNDRLRRMDQTTEGQ